MWETGLLTVDKDYDPHEDWLETDDNDSLSVIWSNDESLSIPASGYLIHCLYRVFNGLTLAARVAGDKRKVKQL